MRNLKYWLGLTYNEDVYSTTVLAILYMTKRKNFPLSENKGVKRPRSPLSFILCNVSLKWSSFSLFQNIDRYGWRKYAISVIDSSKCNKGMLIINYGNSVVLSQNL